VTVRVGVGVRVGFRRNGIRRNKIMGQNHTSCLGSVVVRASDL